MPTFTVFRDVLVRQRQIVNAESEQDAIKIAMANNSWSSDAVDFDPDQDVWAEVYPPSEPTKELRK